MLRVINGRRYNTETADDIHRFYNNLGGGDFRNIDETLYKTKKGNFFLAGSGGPMTKYAEPCGNMTGGGEGIQPLSREDALVWLEGHDGDDAIEEHLSDLVKDA